MLEILQFIFSDFWYFVGTVILLGMLLGGIANVILAMRGIEAKNDD